VGLNTEALALAAKINKDIGDGTVVVASRMKGTSTFTTGSLSFDIALGGGWPANQWVEIYGKESHGKSTVVLKTLAANQALDPNFSTLWLAAEHYDMEQAAALGVDNERVVVIPTQDMTFAYDKMLEFAESRSVDLIVLDSYPALIPPEEEQKTMDEVQVALGARITGKFFRKAGPATRRSSTDTDRPMLGIFVNQLRTNIGAFSPYGTPTTTPGGNAKNYAFYTRVEVKRDDWIDEKIPGKNLKIKVGQTIKINTVKNKAAAPGQVASVDFFFRDAHQTGFSRGEYDLVKETVMLAIIYDVIERRGRYFRIGETHRWDGRESMLEALRADPVLVSEIREQVRQIALHTGSKGLTESDMAKAANAGKRTVTRKGGDDDGED